MTGPDTASGDDTDTGEWTLLDVAAAAHYFDVAPATVRTWVRRYRIPRRGRDGRRALYALEDLHDLTPADR